MVAWVALVAMEDNIICCWVSSERPGAMVARWWMGPFVAYVQLISQVIMAYVVCIAFRYILSHRK